MEDKHNGKSPKIGPKSFLSVGPTLHYSHKNVQRCWLLALAAFGLSCLFWSKILSGSFFSFNPAGVMNYELWRLGRFSVHGISIFEYPWQILVLGLLMGIIATAPVLISQLMSFRRSLLFAAAIFLLADLPAFAACVLISCFAVASRPLRFRSRFVAIALCMGPQLLYWAFLGSVRDSEPIRWGFSFAPWICAWVIGLAIAALVLGIGHFTRYRPGLVWIFTVAVLVAAISVFEFTIGFDELDYQLYVAKNSPRKVAEFHDHSITEVLDETISNPSVRRYLTGFFYPTEPIELRIRLKEKIQSQLRLDRWPSWLIIRDELKYQKKRDELLRQYEKFLLKRTNSRRMPIALYYKALLNEYSPDIEMLGQKEILHFYSDYPFERSLEFWYQLYTQFSRSPESIEARWRIAKYLAGQGRFEQAQKLLEETQGMIKERLQQLQQAKPPTETLFSLFTPPADSVISAFDLTELQTRLYRLTTVISQENRTDGPDSQESLARFVMLNPHAWDYTAQLEQLSQKMSDKHPLRDNILLEQAKLTLDERLRAEKFTKIYEQFKNNDAGAEALYNLSLLKISFWRQQSDADSELKKKSLTEARQILEQFLRTYPDNFLVTEVREKLEKIPSG